MTEIPGRTPPRRRSWSGAAGRRPLELVQDAVDRLRRVDPQLGAVVRERYDAALGAGAAARCPTGRSGACRCCSRTSAAHVAGEVTGGRDGLPRGVPRPVDSAVARGAAGRRLRPRSAARRVPELATTVTTEPAALGPTRNPWDPPAPPAAPAAGRRRRSPPARVASPRPATAAGRSGSPPRACGLVGLKPSRGRISQRPEAGESWAGATTDGVADPHASATPRRCSTCWPGRSPATPTRRRRRRGRTPRRSAPTRAGCGSACCSAAAARHEGDDACADAVERTGDLLASARPHVAPAAPAGARRPGVLPALQPDRRGRRRADAARARAAARPAGRATRSWSRATARTARWAARRPRSATWSRRAWLSAFSPGRGRGALVGGGVRPAGHPDRQRRARRRSARSRTAPRSAAGWRTARSSTSPGSRRSRCRCGRTRRPVAAGRPARGGVRPGGPAAARGRAAGAGGAPVARAPGGPPSAAVTRP